MQWRIEYRPAYSVLKILLEPGEEVTAEPDALMLIKGDVEVETGVGGLGAALKRKLFGAESLFLNTLKAKTSAEVWIVPPVPGDIEAIRLEEPEEWIVQDASYLAHYGDIRVSTAWRGIKGLLSGSGFVWLKLSGNGIVWVNSYGALEWVEVGAGEKVIVDNYHFVAMPADTEYSIKTLGLKASILGGEGFVVEVHGPAKLLVQTRVLPAFAKIIAKFGLRD